MRIAVLDIPDEGLQVRAGLGDGWARAAAELGAGDPAEGLSVDVLVQKLGDHIRVSGRASGTFAHACDRCGTALSLSLQGPVDLYYAPDGGVDQVEVDGELGSDELDIGWYDGEALELGDVISEQIALWMPSVVRCDDRASTRKEGPGPCELAASATSAGDTRPLSPFAGVRLPE